MSRRAIGTIYGDDDGNGDVVWRAEFSKDDQLYRADVLRDVMAVIIDEYNIAAQCIFHELDSRRQAATKPKADE